MRMVTRSIPLVALALCLGTAHLSAQQPGSGYFQWYLGGQGGILNYESSTNGRNTLPLGGAHLLVVAKRTGLLLSVEQGFGSDEPSSYTFTTIDSLGNVSSSQEIPVTFNYVRKYSAMLVAFPIKGPATPFFGIGVGVMHTGGHAPDDQFTKEAGSSGFGSLIGGLNFQVSRFSAFGQYQVTTGPSDHAVVVDGPSGTQFVSSGNLLHGPVHTLSAGLRFSLGGAREAVKSGGY
jgi:hypothetical protein